MPSLVREIALSLYRRWTLRTRRRLANQFRDSGTYPATVLFYHRVADSHPNNWSISTSNFLQHLDWIQTVAKFASLDDIRRTQISKHRTDPMVGLTFDDGYSENCDLALPEIIKRQIPCTYFVSTHYIESGIPFPHDVAKGVELKPNTIAELQQLAAQGIEIGGHTHTHMDLGRVTAPEVLRREISDSRKKLQDWCQQPINYFAFPFGLKENITPQAVEAVFEAGFECYLSASGGLNWPGNSSVHIRRVHGDPGMAAIQNWITLDPRKLSHVSGESEPAAAPKSHEYPASFESDLNAPRSEYLPLESPRG